MIALATAATVLEPARTARDAVRMARKAVYAVADQALFSGGNFLAGILLARWLPPEQYGAYSLAYAIFLLFAAVHSAILVEPMMVFGPGKYASRFPLYLKRLLCGHFVLMIPVSVLLLGVARALSRIYSAEARRAFLGLVLGGAAILLFWLVRRVFYVLFDPARAMRGGAVYFLLMAGSVGVLQTAGALSAISAFLGMAVAGLLSSLVMLARFVPLWKQTGGEPRFAQALSDHWRYGRWAMATAAVGWFPGHVYYALLPAWLGLEAAAALRALMNFIMPVLQAITALSMLLLPSLVHDRDRGGAQHMTRTMLVFLVLFIAGGALYTAALLLLRDRIFLIFYGGKYSQYAGWPLLLAAFLPGGTCVTALLSNGLRALERPDHIFWCYCASAISAAAAGIPMAARFGINGALAGLHISSIVVISMMAWYFRKDRRASAGVGE